jgi:hypothetical protein
MDIQERIEKNISQVIREELGDSIHPDKLNSIIKNITEKLTFCLTPDELVLLRIKMDEKTQRELAVLSVIGRILLE